MKTILTVICLALALALPAAARADAQHAGHAMKTSAQAAALAEGTVKKVDKAQGRLTLRHGPLVNLDMPAMTMVFRVQDASWLDTLKPGDNVRFMAEKVNGVFTVTRLERAR